MTPDEKKIEGAVLALLYFGSFDQGGLRCAWKTYDWDTTDRLFEKGYIYDPRNKNKSVVFTPKGLKQAKALFEKLFGNGAPRKTGRSAGARKGKRGAK